MRVSNVVLTILTLGAVLWPSSVESPVQVVLNGARATVSAAPADVRIEHQLIHVTDPVRPRPRPARAATSRLAAVSKPVQPARQETLVVRARRLLVGDGRYRPEPFPRPSQ